jgi:hypothetical protein
LEERLLLPRNSNVCDVTGDLVLELIKNLQGISKKLSDLAKKQELPRSTNDSPTRKKSGEKNSSTIKLKLPEAKNPFQKPRIER